MAASASDDEFLLKCHADWGGARRWDDIQQEEEEEADPTPSMASAETGRVEVTPAVLIVEEGVPQPMALQSLASVIAAEVGSGKSTADDVPGAGGGSPGFFLISQGADAEGSGAPEGRRIRKKRMGKGSPASSPPPPPLQPEEKRIEDKAPKVEQAEKPAADSPPPPQQEKAPVLDSAAAPGGESGLPVVDEPEADGDQQSAFFLSQLNVEGEGGPGAEEHIEDKAPKVEQAEKPPQSEEAPVLDSAVAKGDEKGLPVVDEPEADGDQQSAFFLSQLNVEGEGGPGPEEHIEDKAPKVEQAEKPAVQVTGDDSDTRATLDKKPPAAEVRLDTTGQAQPDGGKKASFATPPHADRGGAVDTRGSQAPRKPPKRSLAKPPAGSPAPASASAGAEASSERRMIEGIIRSGAPQGVDADQWCEECITEVRDACSSAADDIEAAESAERAVRMKYMMAQMRLAAAAEDELDREAEAELEKWAADKASESAEKPRRERAQDRIAGLIAGPVNARADGNTAQWGQNALGRLRERLAQLNVAVRDILRTKSRCLQGVPAPDSTDVAEVRAWATGAWSAVRSVCQKYQVNVELNDAVATEEEFALAVGAANKYIDEQKQLIETKIKRAGALDADGSAPEGELVKKRRIRKVPPQPK
jgi:hypothetical protein